MTAGVHVCPGPQALAETVAARLLEAVERKQGRFRLMLSGGSTPRRLHEVLASTYRDRMPWHRLELFWGDERCVPPEHADSNFKMATDTLLKFDLVGRQHVHRMLGEMPSDEGATAYARTLRSVCGAGTPVFDVILLGMGTDGHTASLFPGQPALADTEHTVVPVHYEAVRPPHRLSVTLPVLQAAAQVWFLVAGADKAPVLGPILRDPGAMAARSPAARVHTLRAHTDWFVDEAARGGATGRP